MNAAVLALRLEALAKALKSAGDYGWSARPDEAAQLQSIADELKQEVLAA